MFYSDKNMGKIKCSNKTFDGKIKDSRNKGLSKKKRNTSFMKERTFKQSQYRKVMTLPRRRAVEFRKLQ